MCCFRVHDGNDIHFVGAHGRVIANETSHL